MRAISNRGRIYRQASIRVSRRVIAATHGAGQRGAPGALGRRDRAFEEDALGGSEMRSVRVAHADAAVNALPLHDPQRHKSILACGCLNGGEQLGANNA
jgi:hypothetical protein